MRKALPYATAAAALLLWVRRRYLVATVEGYSMEPTFHAGDRLLVRRVRRPRTGQILVHKVPDPPVIHVPDGPLTEEEANAPLLDSAATGHRLLVKRIVAVAGDPIPREQFPALRGVPDTVVPPGSFVVAGDNPSVSWDSREFGFVEPDWYVGVVLRRLHSSPSPR